MNSIEIRRVEILGGVPLYRLEVDGETLLRRVVKALAVMQAREETTPQSPAATAPLAQGSR